LLLVRDPRGVAFSWHHTKEGEDETFDHIGVARAAAWWIVTSQAVMLPSADYGDHLSVVRYEDLVRDPASTLASIGEFVDDPVALDGVLQPDGFQLSVTHALSGNPGRFGITGKVAVRLDDRWHTAMPRRNRWTSTILTSPWLHHFGYPLRSG
jgi:hypothetical protein